MHDGIDDFAGVGLAANALDRGVSADFSAPTASLAMLPMTSAKLWAPGTPVAPESAEAAVLAALVALEPAVPARFESEEVMVEIASIIIAKPSGGRWSG